MEIRKIQWVAVTSIRTGEDAGGVPHASSDDDEFLLGVGKQGTQRFLPSVLQDEGNRLAKVRQAFFTRFPLAVGSGHFGAVRDVPWAVSLDNRRELIVHGPFYRRQRNANSRRKPSQSGTQS